MRTTAVQPKQILALTNTATIYEWCSAMLRCAQLEPVVAVKYARRPGTHWICTQRAAQTKIVKCHDASMCSYFLDYNKRFILCNMNYSSDLNEPNFVGFVGTWRDLPQWNARFKKSCSCKSRYGWEQSWPDCWAAKSHNRVHDYGVGGGFPTFFSGDGRGNEVSPTGLPTC